MRLRNDDAGRRSGDLAGLTSRRAGFDSPARSNPPVRDVRGLPHPSNNGAACPGRGSLTHEERQAKREHDALYAILWTGVFCLAPSLVLVVLRLLGVLS